uniref:UPF3 domain-containing protein n=1 Tax=Globisporangium ultimum (strain ATCC 200006 / CBS 805.95 / DAOM BR144) TaxID=431595 RepID=K3XC97_GLOUD
MAPPPGAASRRSASKGGRGGRGRGGGRGDKVPAAAAEDAAPRPSARDAKAKPHDSNKQHKRGKGGAGANVANGRAPSSNVSSARPTRAVNAVMRKVVVRNIPHTTDEDAIWALVEAHGVTRESLWRFVPGKVRGNNRQPTTGRMYLDLKKDLEQARRLIAALNGHVLDVTADPPARLEVEFAPYQKIPRDKQRKDAKVGTIDRDPEYLAFLEELAKPKEKLPSAEVVADTAEVDVAEKPVAALVKYMNERKVHSRDKGKGKSGKFAEKGSAAGKRQTRKKEKTTKEKAKTPKDRRKNADGATDAAKPRKTRGGAKSSSKKDAAASQEPIQPGAIRIMAPKSPAAAAAGNAATQQPSNGTDAKNKSNKKAAAASGGGAGGGGEGSSRSRGKGRGSERVPKEVKPADASGGVDNNGNGEAKNPRRRDSRASAPGAGGNAVGKKDNNAGRGDRKKKVFVPKDQSG